MVTVLLASNPIHGHVGPILQVAAHLVREGHRVTVLTGTRFRERVASIGADFRALGGVADYDDRRPDLYLPEREKYRGLKQAQYDIRTIFIEPIPDQYAALDEAIASLRPDAVLVDGAFGGILPVLDRDAERPPILALGVTPLSQSSRELGPFGMALPPARNAFDRARFAMLNVVARRVIFRPTQQAAVRALARCGVGPRGFVMDLSGQFDRFLQMGPASLEYPRPDIAANTRFVGVLPPAGSAAPLPPWWDDLDATRPIVHVTQGTIDNHDFGRLVRPTLAAFADRDVTVVVSAGGREVDDLGPLPANARAAEFLPYDLLLPRTDVFITNGGFGGVQAALAAGVPVVVAGDTEDKPEVAARVAWTGAGVDLRTGTPDPSMIAGAVDAVLSDPSYRSAARRIAADAAQHDTLAEITHHLLTTRPR